LSFFFLNYIANFVIELRRDNGTCMRGNLVAVEFG